ncbi:MAG: hypothetical protein H7328_09925 [Bdellovibrio sp.]|nr:hypothetical protein [Bdellovibrio sp.]
MSLGIKLKKFFLNTVIISAILATVLSPDLHAQTTVLPAKIDAIVFIPFSKIISQLRQSFTSQNMPFQESLPSYQMQTADGSIQVVSNRVDFSGSVITKSLQSADSQTLNLGLQLKDAVVVSQNINLLITIKKDMGFGWATLRLNMQCQQLKIGLHNENPIAAQIVVQQSLASVIHLDWDLSTTVVATELIGCNEVAGFDNELRNQIKAFIQQSFALETLKKVVNSKINNLINEKIASELAKVSIDYNLKPEQKHKIDEQNNLWVYASETAANSFQSSELVALGQSLIPSMLIKKSSVEELVKNNLNNVLTKNTISSLKYGGLTKITCSRFSQFFAWPALKSLNKCFDLQIQNRIENVQIKDLNTLDMNLKLSSWASGEGHNLAYFSSQLAVSPLSSKAEVLALSATQDPQFTSWSGRSSRISTGLIKTPLQDLLKSTVLDLSKREDFSLFKKNSTIKQIGSDVVLIGLN